MKKSVLLTALAPTFALAATLVPVAAFASTYDYVNTTGNLQSIVADTADQALTLATNIATHSGVMLVTGTVVTTTSGDPLFEYVNTSGNLETISAANATAAMAATTDRAADSGVMEI